MKFYFGAEITRRKSLDVKMNLSCKLKSVRRNVYKSAKTLTNCVASLSVTQ